MQQQANKKRTDIEFQVGDLVLVKLQPYRESTLAKRLSSKLSRWFFGLFAVTTRIGWVAYKLDLPPNSRIHPTFHVSLLKSYHCNSAIPSYSLPELSVANWPLLLPMAILATRTITKNNSPVRQVLVQWTFSSPEDATWEDFTAFCSTYYLSNLEDKVVFEDG